MVRECVSRQTHWKTDSFYKSFGGGQCHLNLSWYRYQEKGRSTVKCQGTAEPLRQRLELGRFRSPGEGQRFSLHPCLIPTALFVHLHTLKQWHPSWETAPEAETIEGLVKPLSPLTPQFTDASNTLPQGSPFPYPLSASCPPHTHKCCPAPLLIGEKATCGPFHMDKVSLLLETERGKT